jgi:hypothetical protein
MISGWDRSAAARPVVSRPSVTEQLETASRHSRRKCSAFVSYLGGRRETGSGAPVVHAHRLQGNDFLMRGADCRSPCWRTFTQRPGSGSRSNGARGVADLARSKPPDAATSTTLGVDVERRAPLASRGETEIQSSNRLDSCRRVNRPRVQGIREPRQRSWVRPRL